MKRPKLALVFSILIFVAIGKLFVNCTAPAPRYSGREQNPVQPLLSTPPREQRDGIAVAILVDTSGSMRDPVTDANGALEKKIVIAGRAVVDTVRRFSEFARKYPDRPLVLGVYEFSTRGGVPSCRKVIDLGPPDESAAAAAVRTMRPEGDTPIGDAMIEAKRDLDATGLSRRHILVVSDGMNNRGYSPGVVAMAMGQQPEGSREGIYFIAFDVAESVFNAVKDAGGLVLAAASETDLRQTIDFILTGKILAEQPVSK
jgi:hypothetical protein